jgi:type II secretory pathway component PulL
MIAALKSRLLTRMGGARAWAAIFFGEEALEMTIARGAPGGQLNVLRQSSASLAQADESAPAKSRWQTAARSLRQQFDPRDHRVVTAVGCEHVFCQTLTLPTAEPAELKQMLDLQIDNLTPLPLDEVVYGFESLERLDGQTRVLVAIARKDAVNDRVEVLEAAGLPPEIVSVDALAVFRALLKRGVLPSDESVNALVVLSTAANFIVYSRGLPLAIRSIVLGEHSLDTAEGRQLVRQELQRSLLAAGADLPQSQIGRVTILALTEGYRSVADALATDWTARTEVLANGAVPAPALSLCMECAVGEAPPLNLLPEEWRQRRRDARRRQLLWRCVVVAGALYLLIMAVFLSLMAVRRAQLRQVQTQIREATPLYQDARGLHGQLLAMQRQLDTKQSALELLREVSTRMPDNLKLNAFQFRATQTVTLRGQAQSPNTIYEFEDRLRQTGLFSEIKEAGPLRTGGAGGLTTFDIVCTLKPSTAAQMPDHGPK